MSQLLARIRAALLPTYIVEQELARGGSSIVYLAHDTALSRKVAVKVVRPELATARVIERFMREGRILANLNHPSIVPVYSAGEADGLFYFVMPFLSGETLAARLARGPLGSRETLRIGLAILDALSAAHRVEVVHCDVTAGNIFLAGDDVLVTDFGIAGIAGGESDAAGTTGAMAPERSRGAAPAVAADIYAVGVLLYHAFSGRPWQMTAEPQRIAWSRVPPRFIPVLQRALQWEAAQRFASAADFATALRHAARRRLWPAATAAALTLLMVGAFLVRPAGPARGSHDDLAVLPFESIGAGADSLGRELALLVGLSLEGVPDLRVTAPLFSFRWFDAARNAGKSPDYRALRTTYYTTGRVARTRAELQVRVSVFDSAGTQVSTFALKGPLDAPAQLSDSIALEIIRRVHPRFVRDFGAKTSLSTRSLPALREFLAGEQAFHQGAWRPADAHYRAALAHDSTFLLASWRLLNVWRWQPTVTADPHIDIATAFADHRATLSELDARLMAAQLTPAGSARIEMLEAAARLFPRDGYAALLLGDELLHRGPLYGIPLSRALAALEHAATLDPFLAPAQEHVAWAAIRLGRRAEARQALDRLQQVAAPPQLVDLYTPVLLEQAFVARFDSAHALAAHHQLFDDSTYGLAALRYGARAGLALGVPHTQALLGSWLAQRATSAGDRGDGQEARALAALSLGNAQLALPLFDSAAIAFASTKAELEAAQWRVLPNALGWTIIADAERDAGRRALRALATDPELRGRAAFTLALDALARADHADADRWRAALAAVSTSASRHLVLIVDAARLGAAGNARAALARSRGLQAFEAHGELGDPFARSALHLLRARWFEQAGEPASARRELAWFENQDLVGWPSGSAQSAEVDWVFEAFARTRREVLATAAR